MARRRVVQLAKLTSGVAGAVDTGILDVEPFDQVIVGVRANTAASGAWTGSTYDEGGTAAVNQWIYASGTGIAIGATSWAMSVGGAGPAPAAASNVLPSPGRRMRFQATGGVGGTVDLLVLGIYWEDQEP